MWPAPPAAPSGPSLPAKVKLPPLWLQDGAAWFELAESTFKRLHAQGSLLWFEYVFMMAAKTPIRCWGHQLATVKTRGHAWAWNFLQADVAFPILGSDFLGTIKMMVDISGRSLVLQNGQSVPLATQPSGPLASCVGVAAATPDPGSSPPSLPTVEALEFGPPAAQQNHLRRSWGLW